MILNFTSLMQFKIFEYYISTWIQIHNLFIFNVVVFQKIQVVDASIKME